MCLLSLYCCCSVTKLCSTLCDPMKCSMPVLHLLPEFVQTHAERLHFHFSLSCTEEGNGNPLQCSCLEDPRDGGAWWAAVYGIAQSRTRLKRLSSNKEIINTSFLFFCRSQKAERICEGKEDSPCGENVNLIPNLNPNKKTLIRVRPRKHKLCGKDLMHHSSHNRSTRSHTGHKPHEYQENGENKCSVCGKAFSYLQCFEKHKLQWRKNLYM